MSAQGRLIISSGTYFHFDLWSHSALLLDSIDGRDESGTGRVGEDKIDQLLNWSYDDDDILNWTWSNLL